MLGVATHDALLWGEVVVEGAFGGFVEGSGVGEFVGGDWIGFGGIGRRFEHRCNSSCFKKGGHPISLPNEGGGHAQVGRPAHEEPGAPEGALCMTTIKPRRNDAANGDAVQLSCAGYQTRSLFFSDRETIRPAH